MLLGLVTIRVVLEPGLGWGCWVKSSLHICRLFIFEGLFATDRSRRKVDSVLDSVLLTTQLYCSFNVEHVADNYPLQLSCFLTGHFPNSVHPHL